MMANEQLNVIVSLQDRASLGLKKMGTAVSGVNKTLNVLKGVAVFAGVTALGNLGKAAINAAGELEKQTVAFTTLTGSAEGAEKILNDLADFAKKTPFELVGIRETAKQMLAMGAATEDDMIPTLNILGNAVAAVGGDLNRVAFNFGQVAAQGKLTGRELRDFANNGIPVIDLLADSMGVAKSEIQGMTAAGSIGFAELRQAFIKASDQGGIFNDLMKEQAKTFPGLVSNLRDSWDQFLEKEGQKSLEWAKDIVKSLTNIVENVLPNIMDGFGKVLEIGQEAFGKLASSIISTVYEALRGVLQAIGAVLKGLNAITQKVAGMGFFDTLATGLDTLKTGSQNAGTLIGGAFNEAMGYAGSWSESVQEASNNTDNLIDKINGVKTAAKTTADVIDSFSTEFTTEVMSGISTGTGSGSGGTSAAAKAAEELIKQQEEIFESLTKTQSGFRELRTNARDALVNLARDHEQSMAKMDTQAQELKDSLKELETAFNIQIQGFDKSAAEQVVEQEELIKDLEEQIAEGGASGEDVSELRDRLSQEKDALAAFLRDNKDLEDEIIAAREKASLTDFQRFIDDLNARREESKLEFEEKKLQLEEEVAALEEQRLEEEKIFNQKRIVIQNINEAIKNNWSNILGDMEKRTEMFAQIAADKLASVKAAFDAVSSMTGGDTSTETLNQVSDYGGGGTIINISGNTLLDEEAAEKMGDLILERLQLHGAV